MARASFEPGAMKPYALFLLAGGMLGAAAACESQVTLHLLESHDELGMSGQAGQSAQQAGAAGEAGAGGVSAAGDGGESNAGGNAGGGPVLPCRKLGNDVCNGGDDDCNGFIDDECEQTISWVPDPDGSALGHETGGFGFEEPCADGWVLVGLRVGMGKWLNQVAALCRQVELHADATQTPTAFSATVGPWHDESLAPASSNDTKNSVKDLSCPDDLVLTGADGTTATDSARYIYALRISCAPLIVSVTPDGPVLDSDRSQEITVGPRVCDGCSTTPAYNYAMTVTPGRVATRLFGGVGLWVDRVGFGESLASISAL